MNRYILMIIFSLFLVSSSQSKENVSEIEDFEFSAMEDVDVLSDNYSVSKSLYSESFIILKEKEKVSPYTEEDFKQVAIVPEEISLPSNKLSHSREENYSEEDIILIAKMLYGECVGVPSYEEKAACAWVVLNRVDSGYGSIEEVITAPNQFYGYSESNPVLPELYDIAESTLERWSLGYRDLPIEYLWFASRGDGRNYFRDSYSGGEYWEFN